MGQLWSDALLQSGVWAGNGISPWPSLWQHGWVPALLATSTQGCKPHLTCHVLAWVTQGECRQRCWLVSRWTAFQDKSCTSLRVMSVGAAAGWHPLSSSLNFRMALVIFKYFVPFPALWWGMLQDLYD